MAGERTLFGTLRSAAPTRSPTLNNSEDRDVSSEKNINVRHDDNGTAPAEEAENDAQKHTTNAPENRTVINICVHPDDVKCAVLMACMKALIMLRNRPCSPKELAAYILKNQLATLGGQTPYATVSSRISQHFKRCAESSRKPVLGKKPVVESKRLASRGIPRKWRYFIDQKGFAVGDENEVVDGLNEILGMTGGDVELWKKQQNGSPGKEQEANAIKSRIVEGRIGRPEKRDTTKEVTSKSRSTPIVPLSPERSKSGVGPLPTPSPTFFGLNPIPSTPTQCHSSAISDVGVRDVQFESPITRKLRRKKETERLEQLQKQQQIECDLRTITCPASLPSSPEDSHTEHASPPQSYAGTLSPTFLFKYPLHDSPSENLSRLAQSTPSSSQVGFNSDANPSETSTYPASPRSSCASTDDVADPKCANSPFTPPSSLPSPRKRIRT
ncbi:hypothetical protein DFS34DRAFT_589525 [Phlyctochytrium arcticum]|nr:hypothetical protein DFS34DRAFT_589525 [Phlyctochytrium arcticum]